DHYVELPITGYLGYAVDTLESETGDVPFIAEERGEHGDLKIVVPARFQGRVHVYYKEMLSFAIADAVSAMMAIGLLGLWVRTRYLTRKKIKDSLLTGGE
ncbi:MAG: hypothetical protein IJ589_01120, partial [Lachnospiraceae bacterium]|nr:hypothetical protein [Lachnospiraceae bacterium]